MARPVSLWEFVLPDGEPEEDFLEFYARMSTYAFPLAFVTSYARNRDVKWAIIHSFFGVPYLMYAAIDTLGGKPYLGLGVEEKMTPESLARMMNDAVILEPIELDEPLHLPPLS